MISAVFALCTNQIILGMLILFYVQMQLSEAIIWRGIDTDNTKLNRIGTLYGQYLLPTHNIAIAIGILIVLGYSQIKDYIPLFISIVFYGIILGIYCFLRYIMKGPVLPGPIYKL
jgi:hypothetical protein